jgi:hypothetical protein
VADEKTKKNDLIQLTDEVANKLDNLQQHLTERAQEAGYARDLFRSLGGYFESVPNEVMLSNVAEPLRRYCDFISAKESYVGQMSGVDTSAYSTVTIITSGAEADWAVAYDTKQVESAATIFQPPMSATPDRTKEYSELLDKINPSLAKTYRSIWETYYGTTDSKNKNSLYSMRQFYDEFFSILAPDENVRQSQFYELKQGEPERKVTRRERLRYAASIHIKDKELAELLMSQDSVMIETYQKLNHLHQRGEVNEALVREALGSMRALLEQWIEAIVDRPGKTK